MMKRFEAPTLEEAYAAAAREFSCSVTELSIEVIQAPSRGFLGFGRKNAVIEVIVPQKRETLSGSERRSKERKEVTASEERQKKRGEETAAAGIPKEGTKDKRRRTKEAPNVQKASPSEEDSSASSLSGEPARPRPLPEVSEEIVEIFDNFYNDSPDIATVALEIQERLRALFAKACFDLEAIRAEVHDDETILVEIQGKDAALLIGKEGYRYKALAHLLYTWIHGTYGYRVRLEIAEFLKNQETMIENYLKPIVEKARREGRAHTKVLDGILVQIALQRLREIFPDKYVAVRTNREGGRYIIVNEFMEKR